MGFYFEVTLDFASIAIALFAFIYGIFFLVYTVKHKHKVPWIYLTVSALMFFIFQSLLLAEKFMAESDFLNILKGVFGIGFASMILLSFVSQRNLIVKSPYILIRKRENQSSSHKKRKKTNVQGSSKRNIAKGRIKKSNRKL